MVIDPFSGIGNIKFGALKKDLRKNLGKDFTSFKKTKTAINETDAYDSLGIYLFYNSKDELNFLELYRPFSVEFKNISFFDLPLNDLLNKLKNIGVKIIPNAAGYDVPKFGFGLYIYEERLDGICLYEKDYYTKK